MAIELNELKKLLPHTYPFMLIDRVVALEQGKSLTVIKNISSDEWVFDSDESLHEQVFPEVLLIEAAAQAALLLYKLSHVTTASDQTIMVIGKTKVEFLGRVFPGDVLEMKVSAERFLPSGGYTHVGLSVRGESVAHVEVFYGIKKG
jgi:3-hydroxyacyl-[acyl-carrier-protein] dehydratase